MTQKEYVTMDAVKLAGLNPADVFGYFEKLCSIPHGSGNTKAISDYLVSFAETRGLRYIQDDVNNVIIFQGGTLHSLLHLLYSYSLCYPMILCNHHLQYLPLLHRMLYMDGTAM